MVAFKRFLLPLETRKLSGDFTMTISKDCADFLRQFHTTTFAQKLKATHAREIVAAYFGYKSHAAQLAETRFPVSGLDTASILVPDVECLNWRLLRLNGLPANTPNAYELAHILSDFLVQAGTFAGKVWLYDTLGSYVVEEYLRENHGVIEDEVSGTMASTNAIFDEYPEYEEPSISDNGDNIQILVSGTMYGSSDQDRPYCGHEIGVNAIVTLERVAGRTSYMEPELDVGGTLEDGFFAEA
jgi:hypothetical protein